MSRQLKEITKQLAGVAFITLFSPLFLVFLAIRGKPKIQNSWVDQAPYKQTAAFWGILLYPITAAALLLKGLYLIPKSFSYLKQQMGGIQFGRIMSDSAGLWIGFIIGLSLLATTGPFGLAAWAAASPAVIVGKVFAITAIMLIPKLVLSAIYVRIVYTIQKKSANASGEKGFSPLRFIRGSFLSLFLGSELTVWVIQKPVPLNKSDTDRFTSSTRSRASSSISERPVSLVEGVPLKLRTSPSPSPRPSLSEEGPVVDSPETSQSFTAAEISSPTLAAATQNPVQEYSAPQQPAQQTQPKTAPTSTNQITAELHRHPPVLASTVVPNTTTSAQSSTNKSSTSQVSPKLQIAFFRQDSSTTLGIQQYGSDLSLSLEGDAPKQLATLITEKPVHTVALRNALQARATAISEQSHLSSETIKQQLESLHKQVKSIETNHKNRPENQGKSVDLSSMLKNHISSLGYELSSNDISNTSEPAKQSARI